MFLAYNPIFSFIGILIIWLVTTDVVATNTTKIGEGILTRWWQQTICRLFFKGYKYLRHRSILVWSGAFIVLGDEALTIAELAIDGKLPQHYFVARQAISGYLASLRAIGLQPAPEIPSVPALDILRESKLPVISDRLWREKLTTIELRRKYLLALVEKSGWSWTQVILIMNNYSTSKEQD